MPLPQRRHCCWQALRRARSLDTTPPMYQQFGTRQCGRAHGNRNHPTAFSIMIRSVTHYRQHLEAIHKDPDRSRLLGYDDLEGLSIGWDGDSEECYRDTARSLTSNDEYELRCQLSVQLNGAYVHFADAQPEKVNGRVMVSFRAIAEALGAEVQTTTQAQSPAKKNDRRLLSRSAASSQPARTARAKPSNHAA